MGEVGLFFPHELKVWLLNVGHEQEQVGQVGSAFPVSLVALVFPLTNPLLPLSLYPPDWVSKQDKEVCKMPVSMLFSFVMCRVPTK